MSITNTGLRTKINKDLGRSEEQADFDEWIRDALKEISEAGNFLHEVDDSATLAEGEYSVDAPKDYKSLEAVTMVDSDDDESEPLTRMSKRAEVAGIDGRSSGEPSEYAEFDSKFWFDCEADAAYTVKFYYYRFHPDDVDTILFGDEFRLLIEALTKANLCQNKKMYDQADYWNGRAEVLLQRRLGSVKQQPRQTAYYA